MNKAMKQRMMSLCLTGMLFLAGCATVTPDAPKPEEEKPQGPQPANAVELYQLTPYANSLIQSYVIKTKNNKIIVIDGGIDGTGSESPSYMPSAIRSILCLEEGDYFEIEAWFLSHPHSDHYYELSKCMRDYTKDSNYKIKEFYFDFPDLADYYAARPELGLTAYSYTVNSKFENFKQNIIKFFLNSKHCKLAIMP